MPLFICLGLIFRFMWRADWVANLLVVLPLGWLGAAAIDWGRSSRRLLVPDAGSPLSRVAVGIEFLQAVSSSYTIPQ